MVGNQCQCRLNEGPVFDGVIVNRLNSLDAVTECEFGHIGLNASALINLRQVRLSSCNTQGFMLESVSSGNGFQMQVGAGIDEVAHTLVGICVCFR
jgi:hypothetical protein